MRNEKKAREYHSRSGDERGNHLAVGRSDLGVASDVREDVPVAEGDEGELAEVRVLSKREPDQQRSK